jgi:hypothetical protein
VLFLLVHIVMVWRAGFRSRMRAMITGTMIAGRATTLGEGTTASATMERT